MVHLRLSAEVSLSKSKERELARRDEVMCRDVRFPYSHP